jgi:hypothetical protein
VQSSFFVFRFGLIVTICLTILCGDSSIAQEAATQEAPATQTKKEPSTEKSAPAEKQPMETKDEQSTAASTETDNGVKDDAKDESNSENNAKSEAEAARSAAHNEKGKSADSNTTTDEKKPKTAEKPRKQPKISVAEITLSGALSEGPSQLGLLGGAETKSLMSFLTRLHKAAEDNKVRSVLLNIQSAGLGRGQLHEVREAISKVRDSGKMVYAQMESGSTGLKYSRTDPQGSVRRHCTEDLTAFEFCAGAAVNSIFAKSVAGSAFSRGRKPRLVSAVFHW